MSETPTKRENEIGDGTETKTPEVKKWEASQERGNRARSRSRHDQMLCLSLDITDVLRPPARPSHSESSGKAKNLVFGDTLAADTLLAGRADSANPLRGATTARIDIVVCVNASHPKQSDNATFACYQQMNLPLALASRDAIDEDRAGIVRSRAGIESGFVTAPVLLLLVIMALTLSFSL